MQPITANSFICDVNGVTRHLNCKSFAYRVWPLPYPADISISNCCLHGTLFHLPNDVTNSIYSLFNRLLSRLRCVLCSLNFPQLNQRHLVFDLKLQVITLLWMYRTECFQVNIEYDSVCYSSRAQFEVVINLVWENFVNISVASTKCCGNTCQHLTFESVFPHGFDCIWFTFTQATFCDAYECTRVH